MENTIPKHIGIIMDGNRRWARKRMLPTFMGHKTGADRIEPLVEYALDKKIQYLTFWAFSTENWKREKKEIETLFRVFRLFLNKSFLGKLIKKQVRVTVLGDITPFPKDIQQNVREIIEESKSFDRITVNFALNYGGRAEIVHAVNTILKEKKKEITEEIFSQYLSTAHMPDPDLVIRTGGDIRLSGFLSWQSAYSELYFTDTLWPDFDEKEFEKALKEFANRQRRFGK